MPFLKFDMRHWGLPVKGPSAVRPPPPMVAGSGGGGGGGRPQGGGGSRGVIYAYEEINWRLTDQTRGGGVIIHGAETGLFRMCAWGLIGSLM